MLEKAKESVRAARILRDQELPDFAVSRAYYAMFYVAEAMLLGEGISCSKHSAVIAVFGQQFAKTGRVPAKFHRFLIEGLNTRNVADYDSQPGLSTSDAAERIDRAERFLRLGEELMR